MRRQCVDLSGKGYLTRRNDPIEPRRASGDQTAAQQAAVAVQHPHSDMLESIHRCEEKEAVVSSDICTEHPRAHRVPSDGLKVQKTETKA